MTRQSRWRLLLFLVAIIFKQQICVVSKYDLINYLQTLEMIAKNDSRKMFWRRLIKEICNTAEIQKISWEILLELQNFITNNK